MEPPSPDSELPPPAYEQEYDRKISDALERSLHISQPQPPALPGSEDEVWEEWDESKFEAAAAAARTQGGPDELDRPSISRQPSEKERLARQEAYAENSSEGASSSTSPLPTVRPLNIGRKLPSSPPTSGKERPSWLAEAQLDTSADSSSSLNFHTPSNHNVPPEEEEPDEQLPAFTPVGPSLEGPPYVVREPRRLQLGSSADSPPQSPLDGVDDSDGVPKPPSLSPSSLPAPSSHRPTYRQPSAVPRQSMSPHMLRASSMPSSTPRPPPMRFDPTIAYTKPHTFGAFQNDNETKPPVDASAFYHSSVSSLLVPNQQAHPPQKSTSSNGGTLATSSAYMSGTSNPYSQAPQVHAAPLHPASAPVRNSYYPQQGHTYVPNQYAPYSQQQQPQQVPSTMYGTNVQGAAPAAPHAQWSPYMYNGGQGQ